MRLEVVSAAGTTFCREAASFVPAYIGPNPGRFSRNYGFYWFKRVSQQKFYQTRFGLHRIRHRIQKSGKFDSVSKRFENNFGTIVT
jgi:hypothetical protein